jgi:hypothetical protein
MNKEELEKLVKEASTEEVKKLAQAELQKIELQEKAAEGDALSRTLLALKETIDTFKQTQKGTGTGTVNAEEVKKLVASMKSGIKGKVSYNDLDPELQSKLSGQVKTTLTLTTPYSKGVGKELSENQLFRPLFQKLLSDFVAKNNVYLFGGAGTGKTFIVEQLANFLGKLEMAWSNIGKNGDPMKGAILCLDELPKLDPNTAGVLNAALAKIKLGTPEDPVFIYNGKGEKVYKKNIFVVATGNTKLNETSVDYEANFKQDLSLQDRFVGSCYEVVADYKSEFENALQDFAFLFIFMTKIREEIIDRNWTGVAFVSYRILISLRDTYIVYRDKEMQQVANTALKTPKTLKEGIDSFLSLFKPTQISELKRVSNYDNFVNNIIPEKNKLPLGQLNTESELLEIKSIIARNEAKLNEVNN